MNTNQTFIGHYKHAKFAYKIYEVNGEFTASGKLRMLPETTLFLINIAKTVKTINEAKAQFKQQVKNLINDDLQSLSEMLHPPYFLF